LETPNGRDHLEELREYNIRMDLRNGWEGVDWMYLSLGREQWRTRMKSVMNLEVQ
jgi:hypothetical protein